jgi:two-component system response regulator YesN
MSLYKILLVDDEEEIRKGIIKKIKWEELGFCVVGEAENGMEALDIIDKTLPDIVFTDIKMPFMDGIKLAENIKYRFPTIKVIILSGFDDFEYAQEAIKLGVMRYILKPINSIEMNEILKELKELLDEEILSISNIEKLKVNYQKSLPFLKERFLNHWIAEYVTDEMIAENISSFDLDLLSQNLVVAVIRPDELIKETADSNLAKNKALLKIAIFNICEEIIELKKLGIAFMKINEVVLIIPIEDGESPKTNEMIFLGLDQIRATVQKYLNTTVTIGVGTGCTAKSMLYKSYSDAVAALDYTVIVGNNKIIYIEDIEPAHSFEVSFTESDERTLLAAIKVGNADQIEESISTLVSKIEGVTLALKDYQLYIVDIISSILKLKRTMALDLSTLFSKEDNFLAIINHFKTKEEIKEWLYTICIALSKEISLKRNTNKNELIERAKEYIEQNYFDEELSAEKLCNYLHISTNYFSALFKKETKFTFTSYLTLIRIDKAKELLRTTELKTFDIGNKVGYSEGHYFSYVFKKITGISPTEYRNGKD